MIKIITLILSFLFFIVSSIAGDILSANDQIQDGDTIVSAGGEFELGFFTLGSSTNRYLSIRYKAKASGTIAWVANRDIPLTDALGILELSSDGTLRVLNSTRNIIWSSKSSTSIRNPVAQLLDTGNLVIRSESDTGAENFFWQSFDFADSTFLPGMKLGMNLVTKTAWSLNSWKSKDDPSTGSYKVGLDISGYPQILGRNDSAIYFRAGAWNGERFVAIPSQGPNSIYTYEYVFNEEEIYYKYQEIDRSVPTKIMLEPDGRVVRYTWTNRSNSWIESIYFQSGICGYYAECGAFSSCSINNPSRCDCLDNFTPKNPEAWKSLNFSEGCVHETQFNCSTRDSFHKILDKMIPATQNCTYDFRKNLKECEKMCLKNCSCTAYANTNSTGKGSGCLLWFGELIDIRDQEEGGQALYVRIAPSGSGSRGPKIALIILLPVLFIFTVVIIGCYLCYVQKFRKQNKTGGMKVSEEALPYFEFTTIANATNNFSFNSKLGEGGFGPVYKGTLEDGEEIAVKRQSACSTQGVQEFKNEVSCIAKLQHRNLVRLLGWSAEKGERMLIYEYMPNKSLDNFIFGVYNQRSLLDWPKRYSIIDGITRGLLYLHQDSRLRVIHRDLKASNILLDSDMNPKISDFGMARIFRGTETEANTARVVGTYGYMSPEYALEGAFSVKSDVYSFGVLAIEIVSGKRNRFFTHPAHNLNLLGHAWTAYNEGRLLELIDESMLESSDQNEVFRVIQIGLLCVQQYPKDRPNMSSVLMMLTSKVSLPHPKQPGFFTERKMDEPYCSTNDGDSSSGITDTLSGPR